MSREFVDNVEKEDNVQAQDAFKAAMIQKVGSSLEDKRTEVAKTFVQQRKEMEETDEEDV
tara:strand:+ start:152 stop:331 length:180 start_codon:yes stop_codon:yes gene_type:complete